MNNIGHIVIMGNCSIDNIIKADGTYHQHVCGGNSFHAAMAAGIIADNVSILVNVPENFPQRFIDDLNQHGIDTSLIKRREKSVIWEELFIYRANGDREDGLFVNIKENLEGCCVSKEKLLSLSVPSSEKIYCYDDFRADYYPDIDTIPKEWKVQSLHIAPQLLAVHKKAISTTIPIKTLDPGHYLKDLSYSEILDIVSDCTVFAPSKKELRYIFPTTDIVESVIKLGADSNTNIVCKNGKNGAVVFDAADKRCYEVGIFPEEKVENLTGAGDSFCGALNASLASGFSILQSVRMATVVAAKAIEVVSATDRNTINLDFVLEKSEEVKFKEVPLDA